MNGWIPISERRPATRGAFLITNNIEARDGFGNMRCLWLTRGIYQHAHNGRFYAHSYPAQHRIENISHWRPAIPEEQHG